VASPERNLFKTVAVYTAEEAPGGRSTHEVDTKERSLTFHPMKGLNFAGGKPREGWAPMRATSAEGGPKPPRAVGQVTVSSSSRMAERIRT